MLQRVGCVRVNLQYITVQYFHHQGFKVTKVGHYPKIWANEGMEETP